MTGETIENYKLIDIEGLATCLAQDTWNNETSNRKEDELYELIVTTDETNEAVMERQIKPHFATSFFNLREEFLKLIMEFKK